MTTLPLPSPADAWWCPTCQIHRSSSPTWLCPSCEDDLKRGVK